MREPLFLKAESESPPNSPQLQSTPLISRPAKYIRVENGETRYPSWLLQDPAFFRNPWQADFDLLELIWPYIST
ncbi:hypothetical protein SERLADRAFT_448468 [Serpula lacrymans var. lacrymans S7.9]|uniref:Uncharacterized protein n=1 Tax=Serpula lacrymans var. lacrymans (strain S7.9) TaxID=578457 RepID=F8NT21_SERL9|nr:uncharacterized protein SERLADRAFT_448468 [Serpula lacrymans var. lacrymans S7.9]EGO25494.1 hypothetical protein SERLADRAFT_448468 [Serpula lacrymans var. lacrymans S7.9]